MKGRLLAWPVLILLLLGLAGQTFRWRHRLTASRLLVHVEVLSLAAASAGKTSGPLMAANLAELRRAAALDPVEVGIPIARGTQYLLLQRAEPALLAYREALALEPKWEIYVNLGRAQWMAGRRHEALRSFGQAVRLNPQLAGQIPVAPP